MGTNTKMVGETKNLSSSGVLFTSNAAVAVGEPIEYFITFPKQPNSRAEVRLRCVGTVLREDPESSKFCDFAERLEFIRYESNSFIPHLMVAAPCRLRAAMREHAGGR